MLITFSRTLGLILYVLYFDSNGKVMWVSVPEYINVTGIFYKDIVLTSVIQHYAIKHPWAGLCGIHQLFNSTPANYSTIVIEYLEEHNVKTLPHPPYSPDFFSL